MHLDIHPRDGDLHALAWLVVDHKFIWLVSLASSEDARVRLSSVLGEYS